MLLQCHLSQISSKTASSKSSRSTRRQFWHAMSLHWPHALECTEGRSWSRCKIVYHICHHNYIWYLAGAALGLLTLTFAREQGLLRILPIPHSSVERSFPFPCLYLQNDTVTEIGRRLRSAEASLVVRIQLLWPLSFETSGATTAMAATQTIILAANIYKSLAPGSVWWTSNWKTYIRVLSNDSCWISYGCKLEPLCRQVVRWGLVFWRVASQTRLAKEFHICWNMHSVRKTYE